MPNHLTCSVWDIKENLTDRKFNQIKAWTPTQDSRSHQNKYVDWNNSGNLLLKIVTNLIVSLFISMQCTLWSVLVIWWSLQFSPWFVIFNYLVGDTGKKAPHFKRAFILSLTLSLIQKNNLTPRANFDWHLSITRRYQP